MLSRALHVKIIIPVPIVAVQTRARVPWGGGGGGGMGTLADNNPQLHRALGVQTHTSTYILRYTHGYVGTYMNDSLN